MATLPEIPVSVIVTKLSQ